MKPLLVALLIAVPANAQDEAEVSCQNGYCIIREDTLREMLAGQRKLIAHVTQLRHLCGWGGK